jgi:benzylsuccinate CoA-transferase BbsF subunit
VSVTSDAEWRALAAVVGGDALAADARYHGASDRLGRADELDDLLAAWASGVDVVEAFHRLQAAGVPASPVLVDELLEADPNAAARAWLRPLTATDVGTFAHVGPPFAGIPMEWRRGSPALGEDNRHVFQGILGLDDAAYARLVEQRIAVEDYLDSDLNPV